jgi:hypothetical protein
VESSPFRASSNDCANSPRFIVVVTDLT